jgi:hypothetical protein
MMLICSNLRFLQIYVENINYWESRFTYQLLCSIVASSETCILLCFEVSVWMQLNAFLGVAQDHSEAEVLDPAREADHRIANNPALIASGVRMQARSVRTDNDLHQ